MNKKQRGKSNAKKFGFRKKLDWKYALAPLLLIIAIGGFIVYKSQASTAPGWKTILSNREGSVKACRYYSKGKSGSYVVRVSVQRQSTVIVSSAVAAGSNKAGDSLLGVKASTDKKTAWYASAYQTYDLTAPTRYVAAYLYRTDNTNWYSTPTLINGLPSCQM